MACEIGGSIPTVSRCLKELQTEKLISRAQSGNGNPGRYTLLSHPTFATCKQGAALSGLIKLQSFSLIRMGGRFLSAALSEQTPALSGLIKPKELEESPEVKNPEELEGRNGGGSKCWVETVEPPQNSSNRTPPSPPPKAKSMQKPKRPKPWNSAASIEELKEILESHVHPYKPADEQLIQRVIDAGFRDPWRCGNSSGRRTARRSTIRTGFIITQGPKWMASRKAEEAAGRRPRWKTEIVQKGDERRKWTMYERQTQDELQRVINIASARGDRRVIAKVCEFDNTIRSNSGRFRHLECISARKWVGELWQSESMGRVQ